METKTQILQVVLMLTKIMAIAMELQMDSYNKALLSPEEVTTQLSAIALIPTIMMEMAMAITMEMETEMEMDF